MVFVVNLLGYIDEECCTLEKILKAENRVLGTSLFMVADGRFSGTLHLSLEFMIAATIVVAALHSVKTLHFFYNHQYFAVHNVGSFVLLDSSIRGHGFLLFSVGITNVVVPL